MSDDERLHAQDQQSLERLGCIADGIASEYGIYAEDLRIVAAHFRSRLAGLGAQQRANKPDPAVRGDELLDP